MIGHFLNEKRRAARLPSDPPGVLARVAGAVQQLFGKLNRFALAQGVHNHIAAQRPLGPDRVQNLQALARPRALAAVDHQEQQSRRLRGTSEFRQHGGAVRIAPLHIVDHHHQGEAFADAADQLAERGKGPPPQFVRVGNFLEGLFRHHRDPRQDWKDPGQGRHLGRQ